MTPIFDPSSSLGWEGKREEGAFIEVDDNDKATCLSWTIGDEFIIAGFDSGFLIKYDVATGREVVRAKIHTDRINRITFNRDKTLAVTASKVIMNLNSYWSK